MKKKKKKSATISKRARFSQANPKYSQSVGRESDDDGDSRDHCRYCPSHDSSHPSSHRYLLQTMALLLLFCFFFSLSLSHHQGTPPFSLLLFLPNPSSFGSFLRVFISCSFLLFFVFEMQCSVWLLRKQGKQKRFGKSRIFCDILETSILARCILHFVL